MRIVMLALPLLVLAACKQEPSVDVRNATAEEVAEKVKDSGAVDALIQPGEWQYDMTLVDVSAPNMPPAAVAQMKAAMSSVKTMKRCLTADDVKKMESMAGDVRSNCRYDHYTMGGGKVDGKMQCSQNGMTQDMTMTGTYGPGESDMTMKSVSSGGPMGGMAMTMNIKGKRLGDCTAPSAG